VSHIDSWSLNLSVMMRHYIVRDIGVTLGGGHGGTPLQYFFYLRSVFLATELKRGKWRKLGWEWGKGCMYIKGWLKPIVSLFRNLAPSLIKFSNSHGRFRPLPLPLLASGISQVTPVFAEFNPLAPELNPSAQHCLKRFCYWGFCFLNRAFR
jgi:hypothetical protein